MLSDCLPPSYCIVGSSSLVKRLKHLTSQPTQPTTLDEPPAVRAGGCCLCSSGSCSESVLTLECVGMDSGFTGMAMQKAETDSKTWSPHWKRILHQSQLITINLRGLGKLTQATPEPPKSNQELSFFSFFLGSTCRPSGKREHWDYDLDL